jgi:hypothetical protein
MQTPRKKHNGNGIKHSDTMLATPIAVNDICAF